MTEPSKVGEDYKKIAFLIPLRNGSCSDRYKSNSNNLQEDLAELWLTVQLFSDLRTNTVLLEESSEGNLSCVLTTTFRARSLEKQHLDKPGASWKQVLWSNEVKMAAERRTGCHEEKTCPAGWIQSFSNIFWKQI